MAGIPDLYHQTWCKGEVTQREINVKHYCTSMYLILHKTLVYITQTSFNTLTHSYLNIWFYKIELHIFTGTLYHRQNAVKKNLKTKRTLYIITNNLRMVKKIIR